MIALGIETSCDETSVAVVNERKILASPVLSQDDIHAIYGGVVPELASRRHMETITPLFRKALAASAIDEFNIDVIAVTRAPGLLGSLLVGLQFAKGLSLAWSKPFIGVNHLEGHLNAIYLSTNAPTPHIGIVVSGGHTSIYLVQGFGKYKRLGNTVDDAAGEAFDKVAKLLDLGYPGGPIIAKTALAGNPKAFRFSPPKVKGKDYCLSFSGIKTAVMHLVSSQKSISDQFKADLAASFQEAVCRFIVKPVVAACKKLKIKNVVLGGGVAANLRLRDMMKEAVEDIVGGNLYIPPMELCTDNAAMIAYVGLEKFKRGISSPPSINAAANEEIG